MLIYNKEQLLNSIYDKETKRNLDYLFDFNYQIAYQYYA